jgi:hypothetical protein
VIEAVSFIFSGQAQPTGPGGLGLSCQAPTHLYCLRKVRYCLRKVLQVLLLPPLQLCHTCLLDPRHLPAEAKKRLNYLNIRQPHIT